MIFFKKISIALLFTFSFTNAFSSTFTIENETGVSPYTSYTKTGVLVEDFRIRVTYHNEAKDLAWLNDNKLIVNKAHVPEYNGEISKPVKIKFPGYRSSDTKFITLYLTASSYAKNTNHFLNAVTFELDNPQRIENVHVRFKGINYNNDDPLNVELVVNGLVKTVEFKNKFFKSYLGIDKK